MSIGAFNPSQSGHTVAMTTENLITPTYDPTRTNVAGAIIVGLALLLYAQNAY